MKNGRLQCKDIPDENFLNAIRKVREGINGWASMWRVSEALGIDDKLCCAKARSLIKRGLADGCPCGCRGDFIVVGEGRF
jgi:hypothetical protein